VVGRREPTQIAALDHVAAALQDARELASLGRILPVDRAQRFDVPVEKGAGDDAARRAGLDAVPCAQHQRRAMELESGQALLMRPAAGVPSLQPPHQATGIAMSPPKMRIDRKDDRRMNRLRADVEPELVISLVVGGDGVEAIGSQFAEDGQRARIRQRSSREAVRGSSDNQRGREALRPPHRMGRRCRCRRVGGETPTPSGARVG